VGVRLRLEQVPRREAGMSPYEVLLSESQERMLLVVESGREAEVSQIFRKWELECVPVGEVTKDGLLRVEEDGREVVCVPVAALVDEAPAYDRPQRCLAVSSRTVEVPEPEDFAFALLRLLASPNIASKEWVFRQYDHMVRTNTVALPGADAAVLRLKGTSLALGMTVDGNGRYCFLDPYRGGMLAVAEAARNLAACGLRPLAITNCLNFGNPERPEVMWQFAQVVEGMAEAARRLNTPVTGGNVSFYNETLGKDIFPTPVVGMVGLLEEVQRRVTPEFKRPGDICVLLGRPSRELGGSEYVYQLHQQVAGRLPGFCIEDEVRLIELVLEANARGLLQSAHDCSDGGLGVALAEACCLSDGLGARVRYYGELRPDVFWFNEAPARMLVSVREEDLLALERLAERWDVPWEVLGRVVAGGLEFEGLAKIPEEKLSRAWQGAIPELME